MRSSKLIKTHWYFYFLSQWESISSINDGIIITKTSYEPTSPVTMFFSAASNLKIPRNDESSYLSSHASDTSLHSWLYYVAVTLGNRPGSFIPHFLSRLSSSMLLLLHIMSGACLAWQRRCYHHFLQKAKFLWQPSCFCSVLPHSDRYLGVCTAAIYIYIYIFCCLCEKLNFCFLTESWRKRLRIIQAWKNRVEYGFNRPTMWSYWFYDSSMSATASNLRFTWCYYSATQRGILGAEKNIKTMRHSLPYLLD